MFIQNIFSVVKIVTGGEDVQSCDRRDSWGEGLVHAEGAGQNI
jgi:hypothetical protein